MILLIRHGQSANNAAAEQLRVCDPDLTELGMRQAARTAAHLAELPITNIYCSPFLRALETARPIADLTQKQVFIHAEIFEQGGCYSGHEGVGRRGEPGMGASQLREKYPGWHVDASISDAGWWGRDYESEEQAELRAERVARWMAEEVVPQNGLSVFVMHADFKQMLIEALLRESPEDLARLSEPLYNVGISHFERSGKGWTVRRLNCVQHLGHEMISL